MTGLYTAVGTVQQGRALKLSGVRTPVRRALELMNLLKVFEQV